jgi:hypothetical protein
LYGVTELVIIGALEISIVRMESLWEDAVQRAEPLWKTHRNLATARMTDATLGPTPLLAGPMGLIGPIRPCSEE